MAVEINNNIFMDDIMPEESDTREERKSKYDKYLLRFVRANPYYFNEDGSRKFSRILKCLQCNE